MINVHKNCIEINEQNPNSLKVVTSSFAKVQFEQVLTVFSASLLACSASKSDFASPLVYSRTIMHSTMLIGLSKVEYLAGVWVPFVDFEASL